MAVLLLLSIAFAADACAPDGDYPLETPDQFPLVNPADPPDSVDVYFLRAPVHIPRPLCP